jgi:glucosamine 6-phosphate synthetase-like amidotransferase/phosphosugar isomerase protein
MCQLAAYVGSRPIAPLLLESLKLQQAYIGAHATGLAVVNEGVIEMVKGVGHVDHVRKTTSIDNLSGTTGIAHSRHSMNIVRDPKYNVQGGVHPWLVNDGSSTSPSWTM